LWLLVGLYRGFYILNWTYRSYTEHFYRHSYEVYAAAVVQTALYSRFFWYYYRSSSSCCCSSSSSSSGSEQQTTDVAIELPILLCGASLTDVDAAEAATVAAAAAVAAQQIHDPTTALLSDDAVRSKELLEPLQPGVIHVV
jgi:hypothetical protein